ncbi:hypothetical protein GRI97_16650 [Altererythrobacter xixiisoli]|uniref:Uncharacterized protein n=1 Tax=Croceibacterium xixiisoli TaxID=1476466 RepID=A0A6I4TZX1_9SPHN|nr:DUF6683 family protein [Croceibacterium xixiisoli]MXP00622.1 hypothetical protein [Croceibacterium xixiisoli]
MKRLSPMIALAVMAMAPPLAAQDISGVFDMGLLTGDAAMDPVIEQSREMAIRQGEADPLPDRARATAHPLAGNLAQNFSATTEPVPAAALGQLTYRPSPAVREANFARFVERSRAADPQGAEKLAQALRSTDVMAAAEREMAPMGLSTSNVADASAVYLGNAWLLLNGETDDPPAPVMQALRDQLARAMIATPEFAAADDATKQELAEAMIIHAILIAQYTEMARANPDMLPAVQDAVAAGVRGTLGLELRGKTLDERGLR